MKPFIKIDKHIILEEVQSSGTKQSLFIQIDAGGMYEDFTSILFKTGDPSTVASPADPRETRYLRQIQALDTDSLTYFVPDKAVDTTSIGLTYEESESIRLDHNALLEILRHWGTYLVYQYAIKYQVDFIELVLEVVDDEKIKKFKLVNKQVR